MRDVNAASIIRSTRRRAGLSLRALARHSATLEYPVFGARASA